MHGFLQLVFAFVSFNFVFTIYYKVQNCCTMVYVYSTSVYFCTFYLDIDRDVCNSDISYMKISNILMSKMYFPFEFE